MSLIYSALAEIDAQAHSRAPVSTPAPASSVPTRWRGTLAATIMGASVALVAVGVGAYLWAERTGSIPPATATVATTPAAGYNASAAPLPAVAATEPSLATTAVTGGALVDAVQPAARTVTTSTAPASDAVVPLTSGALSPAITPDAGTAGQTPYAGTGLAATAQPVGEPRVRVIDSRVPSPTVADGAPLGAPAAAAPLPSEPQAPSTVPPADPATAVQATANAATYLGGNNFVKVGKQPQVDSDEGVASQIAAFNAAMGTKDHAGARDALASLQERLPAQSMTMLRMQAWYAVDSGNDSAALALYQRILERLPDDVNAGINLALIDWRANRRHAAQSRIGELHTRHPDQILVTRNWQAMQDGD